jgi:hypothetical protein
VLFCHKVYRVWFCPVSATWSGNPNTDRVVSTESPLASTRVVPGAGSGGYKGESLQTTDLLNQSINLLQELLVSNSGLVQWQ